MQGVPAGIKSDLLAPGPLVCVLGGCTVVKARPVWVKRGFLLAQRAAEPWEGLQS